MEGESHAMHELYVLFPVALLKYTFSIRFADLVGLSILYKGALIS